MADADTEPTELAIAEEGHDDVIPFTYAITAYGADYPVDGLVQRINSGDVYVPRFQRGYVWDRKRASAFVESLLLGLPVPGIFLAREKDTERLLVIDGQQRLRTLQYYYAGNLPKGDTFGLSDVQPRFAGVTYADLPDPDRRRLDNSIIHATVVRQDVPTDDESSIYLLFARLNTGGLILSPQEIRAALYHGQLNDLLGSLNEHAAWRQLYGAPPSKRMRDQELILRFFAFLFRSRSYSKEKGGLKQFLNEYMGRNRNLSHQAEAELRPLFESTADAVYGALGRGAFRPKGTLNAAVYDSVMVAVARRVEEYSIEVDELRQSYSALLALPAYRDATEVGTNADQSVKARMELARAAFAPVSD